MVSDFLLPFSRLNFASLGVEERRNILDKTGLSTEEAVEIFEYGKNNDGYWDGVKLHKQVMTKALPIAEALYPGYSLLFLFDNATSHSVYAKDALQAKEMNKGIRGKKEHLRNGWFDQGNIRIDQPMSFEENGQRTAKGIQKVLEERGLWPEEGLNLECPKPKCLNCQQVAECKVCVKGHKCDLCKVPRQHSGSISCSKSRRCDACVSREERFQCVAKSYCSSCLTRKKKCGDCEQLPLKCISEGN